MQTWGRWYSHPLVQINSMMTGAAMSTRLTLWLWSFARGKPRLGGLSVEKTFERQVDACKATLSKQKACGRDPSRRRHRKAGKAWFKVKEVFDSICTKYIPIDTRYICLHSWHIPKCIMYPIFAGHCLKSDSSISDSSESSLQDIMQCVGGAHPCRFKHPKLPQCMKKSIQT
jgi:hypothetical protein